MITKGLVTGRSYMSLRRSYKSLRRAYQRQINSIHIKHPFAKYCHPNEDNIAFFFKRDAKGVK